MLDDSSLMEWRDHPVTEHLFNLLNKQLNQSKDQVQAAYWAGNPIPADAFNNLQGRAGLLDDLENATAEDFNAWGEQLNG